MRQYAMMRLVLLVVFAIEVLNSALLPPEADQRLALEIYRQMVEMKSGYTTGSTTPIAQAVAARVKAAGFPAADIFVGGAIPTKANVVVRYRGTGARRPILLLAHIDVVEAKREDWTTDPFQFIEKDGYFYGRGTADDKAQAAIWIASLIRYKREGFKPDRDIIVALTADEEGGGPYNGVDWLIKNHKDLIDADFALNEGGKGESAESKRISNDVQAAEKSVIDFRLEVHNKGGHSSQPEPDNAIYRLAGALTRLGQFGFPLKTNEVTAAYFTGMAKTETGPLQSEFTSVAAGSREAMEHIASLSPLWNSLLRTTCVATELQGGHARNALPQLATANVNCRVLPGETLEYVQSELKRIVGDDHVAVLVEEAQPTAPGSPLRPDLMRAINRITDSLWPGVIVLPMMSTGATDGRFLRAVGIPAYGVQGFFQDRNDNRSHGRDERMMVRSFYEGQTFLYELVKSLAAQN